MSAVNGDRDFFRVENDAQPPPKPEITEKDIMVGSVSAMALAVVTLIAKVCGAPIGSAFLTGVISVGSGLGLIAMHSNAKKEQKHDEEEEKMIALDDMREAAREKDYIRKRFPKGPIETTGTKVLFTDPETFPNE